MKLPLIGGAYDDPTKAFSAQRAVNCRVEAADKTGTRAVAKQKATFGVKWWASTPNGEPARRLWYMHQTEVLFAVCGNKLYSFDQNAVATELGTLSSSSGRVGIADNGVQLTIRDGLAGYVWDTSTSSFSNVADPDFKVSNTVDFLDRYFVSEVIGKNQYIISNLSDGTNFNALDIASPTTSPGVVRAVVADHAELWLFKESITEIHTNTGNVDFPFTRLSGATIERGIAGPYTVVKEDNSIFWLGNDRVVYRAEGYNPRRISTKPIERIISQASNLNDAWMGRYIEDGVKIIVLQVPAAGLSLEYSVATQEWNERESFGLPCWRASDFAHAYGLQLVGDAFTGVIGQLDPETFTEYGDKMRFIRTTQPLHNDIGPFIVDRMEILFEAGYGLQSGQGSDPEFWVRISRDGGITYGNPIIKKLGKQGEYDNLSILRSLGHHKNSVFEIMITDPVRRTIIDGHLVAEELEI